MRIQDALRLLWDHFYQMKNSPFPEDKTDWTEIASFLRFLAKDKGMGELYAVASTARYGFEDIPEAIRLAQYCWSFQADTSASPSEA